MTTSEVAVYEHIEVAALDTDSQQKNLRKLITN